jgi:hypothetical protein
MDMDPKEFWGTFWADFDESRTVRGQINIPSITATELHDFLTTNDLNFVVRGHQDSESNSYLCGSPFQVPSGQLLEKEVIPGFPFHLKDIDIEIKDVVTVQTDAKYVLATIWADKNNFTDQNGAFLAITSADTFVVPCLTLSTNTDWDRHLISDSFAIYHFYSPHTS